MYFFNQNLFKRMVGKFIAFILYYSGLIWIFAYFHELVKKDRVATIIGYHHVTKNLDSMSDPATLYCREKTFNQTMKILSKRFRVIPLTRLVEIIDKKEPIPKRCIVVTFDDGFKDNFEIAFPILLKYKIPATIFLIAGIIDTKDILPSQKLYYLLRHLGLETVVGEFSKILPHSLSIPENLNMHSLSLLQQRQILEQLIETDLTSPQGTNLIERVSSKFEFPISNLLLILNWNEIKEMSRQGIDFGAHTVSHPKLSTLTYAGQEREIIDSKKICEQNLNKPVTLFCYPFGDVSSFNQQTIEILKKNGFRAACGIEHGTVNLDTPPLQLKRKLFNDQPIYEFICEIIGFFDVRRNLKQKLFLKSHKYVK